MRTVAALLALTTLGACAPEPTMRSESAVRPIDSLAETYVRLVLALGEHDADYVDAYIGPEAWREEVRAEGLSIAEIAPRARDSANQLEGLAPQVDESELQRYRHLTASFASLEARLRMLEGTQLSFDEESQALYDAVAPTRDAAFYQEVLDRLDQRLPGTGSITERYNAFRSAFVVPADKLSQVLDAAIEACRARTLERISLPEEESFTVEFVSDKSWSGYNWYQGDYRSLIQINTDLPTYVDRILDLACHEGYPGHHVYSALVERELMRERGWMEFAVYPLFSPRSLIAEGSANFGIEVAFPAAEREAFEREVLFPLAGLDPGRVGDYYAVQELVRELSFAGNEAARRYLDGEFDAEEAAEWLATYSLMSPDRARQRVRFIEQYRSYVINYNLGLELVREFIEARGGTPDDPNTRWSVFVDLLSNPWLPSALTASGSTPTP